MNMFIPLSRALLGATRFKIQNSCFTINYQPSTFNYISEQRTTNNQIFLYPIQYLYMYVRFDVNKSQLLAYGKYLRNAQQTG